MTDESATALPRRILLWSLPVLSAIALSVTLYLLWLGKDAIAGCGNTALLDCEGVLASRWAKWLGLPVSLFAAVVYACLLGCTLFLALNSKAERQPAARFSVLLLSMLAGGAALWFVGLQLFALDGFCPYCLAIHACGLTLAGLSVLLMFMEGSVAFAKPLLISAIGLLILIGGQLAVRPPSIQTTTGEDLVADANIELGMSDKKDETNNNESDGDMQDPSTTDSIEEGADFPALPKPPTIPDKPKLPGSVDISFIDDALAIVDGQEPAPIEKTEEPKEDSTVADPEKPVSKTAKRVNSFAIEAPAAVDGMVNLFGGRVKIKLEDVILLGSPRAPHVIVELFDYSCHHCRALHWRMEEVRQRYGDQLAIIMLPVPLNAGCNETVEKTGQGHENACIYARLAFAVWQKRKSQFPAFHARLIEGPDLPEPGQMRYEASRILGPKELEEALLSEDIENQMKIGIELYKITKMGTIPKLILGDALATGKFDNTEDLFELFEKTLELKPLENP